MPRRVSTTAKVEIDELDAKPAEHGARRALILRYTRGDLAADKESEFHRASPFAGVSITASALIRV